MPTNTYGDEYDNNQYNGDPTLNGHVDTNENKVKQKAKEWFEDVFIEEILPKYFPDIKGFFESFSTPSEPGEYQIGQEKNAEGRTELFMDVCVTPEIYSYFENGHWEELISAFETACKGANTRRPISGTVMSNDDDPRMPSVHFGITAY